jgi:hypothetical protein
MCEGRAHRVCIVRCYMFIKYSVCMCVHVHVCACACVEVREGRVGQGAVVKKGEVAAKRRGW